MKNKLLTIANIISIIMLIAVIPLFIVWIINQGNTVGIFMICFWVPMLAVGLTLFILTFKITKENCLRFYNYCKDRFGFDEEGCIKIKAKSGKVLINTNEQILMYKKAKVKIDEITEFQLMNNQTVIEKSGAGEAFVGGVLFGGTGAMAGAMVGKKQKVKDDYKIFIETTNVMHAGIVISLKVENAYNLYKTLKLLKEKK